MRERVRDSAAALAEDDSAKLKNKDRKEQTEHGCEDDGTPVTSRSAAISSTGFQDFILGS